MAQERRASALGLEDIPFIGNTRMDNIIECNKAITTHLKLVGNIDKQIKKAMGKHKIELPVVYSNLQDSMTETGYRPLR